MSEDDKKILRDLKFLIKLTRALRERDKEANDSRNSNNNVPDAMHRVRDYVLCDTDWSYQPESTEDIQTIPRLKKE